MNQTLKQHESGPLVMAKPEGLLRNLLYRGENRNKILFTMT